MNIGGRDLVPTQSMLLELGEEHRFVREGHDFLDQKRILLAGEILRRLAEYEALQVRLDSALDEARAALARAIARHGVGALGAYPAPTPVPNGVGLVPGAFLGISFVELVSEAEPRAPDRVPSNPSPEARVASTCFSAVVRLGVELAGVQHALERLLEDYRRTERRTRALEDVILPELAASIAAIAEHLDAQELEEAVRVRLRSG